MSGPESNDGTDDRRDDERTLSPGHEHDIDRGPESEPGSVPRLAQPSEPAMAHSPADAAPDPDEPEPTEPAEKSRRRPGFKLPIAGLLSMIRLPSLGSERREMVLDDPRPAGAKAEEAEAPKAHAAPRKRAAARAPFLGLRRETRVGIAVLLTFVVFISALVVKKGWVGKQPITLAIGDKPGDPEKKEEKADKDKDKDEKPAQKDEKPKKESEAATKKPDAPSEPPPGDGSPPKAQLAGEPKPAEPAHPPEVGAEAQVPATLANLLPQPSNGLAPPDELPPSSKGAAEAKLADLPTGPADPLTLPGDPPSTSTPAAPAPSTAATELPTLPGPKADPAGGGLPSMDAKPAATVEPPPSVATPAEKPLIEPPPAEKSPIEPPPAAPPSTPEPQPAAPPSIPEPPAAPPSTPEPPPAATPPPRMPAVTPRVEATAPVLAEKPPTLESVPTAPAVAPMGPAPDATGTVAAAGAGSVAALGAGWVSIPSGGRRIVGSGPSASNSEDSPSPTAVRVADNPRAVEDPAADQVEPEYHRVRPGENFWTISKLYYRSGRYYRALHAANRRQVPDIRELYVGTVLRIPPPEALDRSLIDPPARGKSEDPAATTASRTTRPAEDAADLAAPVRVRPGRPQPDPEAPDEPRRPTYTVRPFETLRSIARDTLNDPRRDREIYNLNRDVLDDPGVLPAGTTLTLPEDAVVGRRAR